MTAARAKVSIRVEDRDFIRVGRSRIEGKGVFAKRKIHEGARIIEYVGAHLPIDTLFIARVEGRPASVYAFRLNETTIIDGSVGGNDSRFINHCCAPNCETYCFDDHMYVYAKREIVRGEELTFDYRLGAPGGRRPTKKDLAAYPCRCGAASCRGTMIAPPKRRSR